MLTKPRGLRNAFTLVELLVVIAIIGVLIGLLLPAVQSARESARRMSCSSSLRNVALAVLNHHDIEGHFPISMGSAAGVDGIGDEGDGSAAGWILQVLPQLEEQPLFDQFEQGGAFEGIYQFSRATSPFRNSGLGSRQNGITVPDLMMSQLPILQCPTDESVTQLSTEQFGWEGAPVALTSYKGVLGDSVIGEGNGTAFTNAASQFPSGVYEREVEGDFTSQNDCHRDTRCRGIFFRQSWRRPVRIAQITDGTTNTLMIGEDIPAYNFHSVAFYSDGDWCSCNTPINNLLDTPPDLLPRGFWWDQRGFRSFHPGGANFALADGSVRFVLETVDNVLYRTSCTRGTGELVNAEL